MAKNTGDTYAESLQKVLSQLAVAGTLADADLDFNTKLSMVITGFLKQSSGQQHQAGMQGSPDATQPGQPGAGGPPAPTPGPGAPGMPPGGGQMGPGLSAAMNPGPGGPQAAPNADELRRVLSGG